MEQGPRQIAELAAELNSKSQDYDIGSLQQYRQRLRGLKQTRTDIFSQPSAPDWVAHYGGRKELQFNIGYEDLPDGRRIFRQGVAFSLEPSRSVPDVGVLIAKIPRFNDYIREHTEELANFQMWDWHPDKGRSLNYAVKEIPPELAVPRTFIFLGRSCSPQYIDIETILKDFDHLLPLYLFTEDSESTLKATEVDPVTFVAREPPKSTWTTASLEARLLDVSLRHTAIQQVLYDRLVEEFGKECVGAENLCAAGGRIDLVVKTGTIFRIYEIKTASTSRGCIREALGQLLDYALWPTPAFATELCIVGEPSLTPDVESFLKRLNVSLAIPLTYIQIILPD